MHLDIPLSRHARADKHRVVEHNGRHLGMVVEKPHGYVVYAYSHRIWPLDGRVFATWDAAEREMLGGAGL